MEQTARIRVALLFVPLLSSCVLFEKDETDTATTPPAYVPTLTTTQEYPQGFLEGQFCTVQSIFQVACVTGCHSTAVAAGGLDLQTDPYYSLVFQPSQQAIGQTLVVPRNPDQSYLYRKMLSLDPPVQGQIMPPSGALDPFFLVPVRDWILAGSPYDCDPVEFGTVVTEPEDGPYHPVGWSAPDQHGRAANLQTDGDCRGCHGQYLDGQTNGVSCDTCHTEAGYADWRTNCTFCHGGVDNQTGAPPKDIDGQINPNLISFGAHSAHVDGDDHYAYGCNQCHYDPQDVLTPGHVFDDVTAGYGELDYTAGYAPTATYFQGTCSNVYCHGDGYQQLGTVTDGQGPLACYDCHADQTTPQYWNQMSGRHEFHLQQGDVYCYECHGTVVDAQQYIVNPQYHVNNQREVQPTGVAWNGATCAGNCHNHNHNNSGW